MKKTYKKIIPIVLFLSLFILIGCSNSSNINQIKHNRENIKTGFKIINSYNRDYIEVEDTKGKITKAELTESEYMFLKNNAVSSNFLYKGKLYSLNNSYSYSEDFNKNAIISNKKIKNFNNIIQTINVFYKNTISLAESITLINNNNIPNLKNINENSSYEIIYNVYEYKGELR